MPIATVEQVCTPSSLVTSDSLVEQVAQIEDFAAGKGGEAGKLGSNSILDLGLDLHPTRTLHLMITWATYLWTLRRYRSKQTKRQSPTALTSQSLPKISVPGSESSPPAKRPRPAERRPR